MKIKNLVFAILIFVLSISLFAQPAPPTDSANTKTSPKTGSIQGQVLGDDGKPVAGALVTAHFIGQSNQRINAMTDSEGKFVFNNLSEGTYSLSASAQAMVFDATSNNGAYKLGDTATLMMSKGGVITGKVVNVAGAPLTGYFVHITQVRDAEGRSYYSTNVSRPALVDDRGVYRIYGLGAGTYLVSVDRKSNGYPPSADGELATYHPASTRETAREIEIHSGEEITGVDIRHLETKGHSISGRVDIPIETQERSNVQVQLNLPGTNNAIANAYVDIQANKIWSLHGIADGEYEITGSFYTYNNNRSKMLAYSEPKKIEIRGINVTGVGLKWIRLGKISGRFILEKNAEKNTCPNVPALNWRDITVTNLPESADLKLPPFASRVEAADEQGNFNLEGILAGKYHLRTRMLNDHLYLKAASLPSATTKLPRNSFAATGLTVSVGQEISDVQLELGIGAAQLNGTLTTKEGQSLPTTMHVHLVPAETEASANLLRHYEILVNKGKFAFRNIAPGKYFVFAESFSYAGNSFVTPVAWNATARTSLRKQAEAANNLIELAPCQQLNDFNLNWEAK